MRPNPSVAPDLQQPEAMQRGWEHFYHGADIGVRGFGATMEESFAQAALATIAVIASPDSIAAQTPVSATCDAPDDELLLVEWLNAVIYEIACRKMLFSRFQVQLDAKNSHHLEATMWGEKVDVARHQPAVEIKGATYTELRVRPDGAGGWIAQCVVDV